MEHWERPVTITGGVVDSLSEPLLRVVYFCVVTVLDALAEADAGQLELVSPTTETFWGCRSVFGHRARPLGTRRRCSPPGTGWRRSTGPSRQHGPTKR